MKPGEMHMKDYIDVSNQENVAPVYFQSLLLLLILTFSFQISFSFVVM